MATIKLLLKIYLVLSALHVLLGIWLFRRPESSSEAAKMVVAMFVFWPVVYVSAVAELLLKACDWLKRKFFSGWVR